MSKSSDQPIEKGQTWCAQTLRSQLNELKEITVKNSWFKVYEVGNNTYAITEPYNYQEVISYLILGQEKALLFDTGMGLSSIKSVVRELTALPLTVLNSHTHYDHMGGNFEFNQILAIDNEYTIRRSKNGMNHSFVSHEVTQQAICLEKLTQLDTSAYYIKPFKISKYVKDGDSISLGKRMLEIIQVPGHTPDAIALLDKQNGYLWTGDTFYEAPIWLFDTETDIHAYQESIKKLSVISEGLNKVFTAHNTPVAEPKRLKELVNAFELVVSGEKTAKNAAESQHVSNAALLFEFEHFSFYIRKDLLLTKESN